MAYLVTLKFLLVGVFLSFANVRAEEAICIEVTTLLDDDDGSLDPELGGISLREAINYGPEGVVISLGRLALDQTIRLSHSSGQLLVTKSLTIESPNHLTTIDAMWRGRILKIEEGAVVHLRGLVFTNGYMRDSFSHENDRGGAIYCDRAMLTLSDCNFTQNFAGYGAGVYCTALDGSATLGLNRCGFFDNASSDGGGICLHSFGGVAAVALSECVFSDNLAGAGGGVYALSGFGGSATLSMTDCTFTGNVSNSPISGGGAIYAGLFNDSPEGSITTSLVNCELVENLANFGGGIFTEGPGGSASLSLIGCTLSGNHANFGGGVFSDGSEGLAELSLDGCTISKNTAFDGGGLYIGSEYGRAGSGGSSILQMDDSTVAENFARFTGGGIFRHAAVGDACPMTLVGCTLSQNSAGFDGGGIAGVRTGVGGAVLGGSLARCIVAGNRARSFPDILQQDSSLTLMGANIVGDVSDSGIETVAGMIGDSAHPVDPKLGPLGNYGGRTDTMPPLPGSPALDAAVGSDRILDQRGFPLAGLADIGAFEFQGRSDLEAIWDGDSDGDGNSFGVEFALGTNPLIFDADDRSNLAALRDAENGLGVQFGYNPDAVGFAVWSVQRSLDLENWTEIYRDVDPGEPTFVPEPSESAVFYRFVAEKVTD